MVICLFMKFFCFVLGFESFSPFEKSATGYVFFVRLLSFSFQTLRSVVCVRN